VRTTADRPPPPPAAAPPSVGEPMSAPGQPSRRPIVSGIVLIVIGGLWLLHVLGVPIVWSVLLPGAVVLIGLVVLVGGRSPVTAGLIPLGVVLAVVAGVVILLPGVSSLETGDRVLVVRDVADLQDAYELGAGQLTLDLRAARSPAGPHGGPRRRRAGGAAHPGTRGGDGRGRWPRHGR
jgi:hypothetical protein